MQVVKEFFDTVSDNPWVMVGLGVFVYLVVGKLSESLVAASKTRQFEHSRREVAAYVAEGAMTPEQGALLLATRSPGKTKDPSKKLASAVQWGTVGKKTVSRLAELRAELDDEQWRRAVDYVSAGLSPDDAVKLAKAGSGTAPVSVGVGQVAGARVVIGSAGV